MKRLFCAKQIKFFQYSTDAFKYHFMRSLIYVPGNSQKMLQKILTLQTLPDVFVPDLEDSVPLSQKKEAREQVKQFIAQQWAAMKNSQNVGLPLMMPRVNAGNEFLYDDLMAIISPLIDGVNVGKTSSCKDVEEICEIIDKIEEEKGIEKGSIKLIPSIETALGLVNAYSICSSRPDRVVAVAFGADDFANDMGFSRNTKQTVEPELAYARNVVAVAAKAANILSLDTPNVNFKDNDMLMQEARAVKAMGFKGKFAIHPNQIPTLNEVFGITKEEYEEAKKIVEAFDAAQFSEEKRGSTSVDGRMVDVPVYRRAKNVLKNVEALREREKLNK